MGFLAGILYFAVSEAGGEGRELWKAGEAVLWFVIRTGGVCAMFFPFFLCRVLGAGDIKLMALGVGILGTEQGFTVLFTGFVLAAASAAWRMYRTCSLFARICRLVRYAGKMRREKRLLPYREWYYEGDVLHLGPYLAAGYTLILLAEGF